MNLKPRYHERFDPVFPCRVLHTRHCPAILDAVCGSERACARFEMSLVEAEDLWLPEIRIDYKV
jgi:hypothetical protein